MAIYQIDPTADERWPKFVERHPNASVFHTVNWLKTLQQTYRYVPVVFTTSPATSELKNGLVFCRVESWLTGHRLVSLPFSDHCEPLCEVGEDLSQLIDDLRASTDHQNLKYVEVRPVNGNFGQASEAAGFRPAASYYLHVLDLSHSLDEVFKGLDRDSVQRRIQRAERVGLSEKCGRSEDLLKEFYGLFVLTRGRHHLPPIPYSWFRNLIQFHGQALEIRLACKDDTPIAAILTLRHKNAIYYKYGCSDAQFNRFGAIPWLFWSAISAAKRDGATRFDLGRTEEESTGLLTFKNHWVPEPQRLIYWRFPEIPSLGAANNWKLKMAKHLFSSMPGSLRTMAGNIIYRHIG